MPEKRVRQTLAQLKDDPDLTEESREAVEAAHAAAKDGDFTDLEGLILRLNQRHPRLTAVLGRMAEALAEMGI